MDIANFHSSIGGFRRADVYAYIEQMTQEHKSALKALEKEKEQLIQKLNSLEEEKSQLVQELDELRTAVQNESVSNELPVEESPDLDSMELAAYRRAEAAARSAKERSDKLKLSAQELLSRTSESANALNADLDTAKLELQEQMNALNLLSERAVTLVQSLQEELKSLGSKLEDDD